MRAAFDRVKKRLLLASANLLLINNSDTSTKEGVCNIPENGTEDVNSRRQVTVKVETEPVYNELDNAPIREPEFLVLSSASQLSSEEESTYLDIDIDKEANMEEDPFKYCTEKISLPCDLYHNESSFVESRPSLTPDEILLLYARIDKTKKTKNRNTAKYCKAEPDSLDIETTSGDERNNGFDSFVNIDDTQKSRLDKSLVCKIRDFHPKKVNDLQSAKTVVDVSLNEFFIEHSRIRCKEKSATYILEGRPLPALPRTQEENGTTPDRDDESDRSDSQHIYATLPMNKS